jgi:hypothetical protein
MTWSHSVATVVIDAADQQGIGFGASDRVIVALVVELGTLAHGHRDDRT